MKKMFCKFYKLALILSITAPFSVSAGTLDDITSTADQITMNTQGGLPGACEVANPQTGQTSTLDCVAVGNVVAQDAETRTLQMNVNNPLLDCTKSTALGQLMPYRALASVWQTFGAIRWDVRVDPNNNQIVHPLLFMVASAVYKIHNPGDNYATPEEIYNNEARPLDWNNEINYTLRAAEQFYLSRTTALPEDTCQYPDFVKILKIMHSNPTIWFNNTWEAPTVLSVLNQIFDQGADGVCDDQATHYFTYSPYMWNGFLKSLYCLP
ncbi:MAG: hypothetical protein H6619_02940 [Deltaproteobacteria bacterium]|nr:hypothetical protein [Deltaproteobacteria bacterium]